MFVEFHSYVPSTGKFVPVIDGTILKGNRYKRANHASPFWDLPISVSTNSFRQHQSQIRESEEDDKSITPVKMYSVRRHSPLGIDSTG